MAGNKITFPKAPTQEWVHPRASNQIPSLTPPWGWADRGSPESSQSLAPAKLASYLLCALPPMPALTSAGLLITCHLRDVPPCPSPAVPYPGSYLLLPSLGSWLPPPPFPRLGSKQLSLLKASLSPILFCLLGRDPGGTSAHTRGPLAQCDAISEQALLKFLLLFYKGQQEAGRVFMELQSCVPALDLCFRSSLGLAEAR